jgi:glucokinase
LTLLALDVGGTKLAAAAGDRVARVPTPTTGEDALVALLNLATSVAADTVDGIGVSFGGHVDTATGVVRRSLNLPGWEGVPLLDVLAQRFRAPAAIANDADAGALGEWDAAHHPRSPVVYVTVSTGVGGGVVIDGNIVAGAHGRAGEVGHLRVEPEGEQCPCGRRGCVETVAAGPAIARRAGTASAEEAVRAALDGDPRARRALTDAAHALSLAVSALLAIIDPAFVAIGGGVAAAGPLLWEPLFAELERQSWPDITIEVRNSTPNDAPLRGARILAERAAAGRSGVRAVGAAES